MSSTGERVTDEGDGPVGRSGPWWWARRRSAVLDAALAAGSAVECLLEGVGFAQRSGISPVVGTLFGLVVGSTLLFRRRWPVAVVLVSIAVAPARMGFLLSLVGLYTLAASEVPRRITAVLAGMTGAGTLLVALIGMNRDLRADGRTAPMLLIVITSVLMAVGVAAPPVLLGLYVRARRRLVESLRERADGLERELSLLADTATERAERARMEERTRIAREMHDVVAHRVSLMVVHSAALKAVALKDPQRAAQGAELLGDMGRQALDELRQMLGVLRSATVPLVAPPSVVLLGGPRLGELGVLVEESRVAGMAVELSVEGERRVCEARVEAAAYRVVQEALTNVHKHAPGANAEVRLAYREEEVAVLVRNGPAAEGGSDVRLPSGGNGLRGMKERVTALGGGFMAGPLPDGGFRVSAMLPDRAA